MYSNTVRQHSERKMSSDESYSRDEFYSSDESRSSYSPFKLLVKPASAENTLVLEDWESTISFWNNGVNVSGRSRCTSSNDTFECEPPATPLTDDFSKNVLIKPASVENTLVLEDWESTISFWNNGVKVSGRSRCTSSNDTFECEPPATPLKNDFSKNVQPDNSAPALHIFPSNVILVNPASAENTLVLEDLDCADSLWNDGVKVSGRSSFTSSNETFECEPPATPLKDDASINFQSDDSPPVLHIFPSDFPLVKPASVENTLVPADLESTISFWNNGVRVSGRSRCTSSNDTFECEPPATPLKDDASINVQSDDSTPALHTFPSDVILVNPASAENTLVLEDLDCADSLWNDGVKVSGRSSFTSSNETFECEPPATPLKDDASINFQSDDSPPVLHIFPSDFPHVNPVSVESTLVLEDWESIISLQSELDNVSESLISEESITDENTWKKKKKTKKNCMRRFFSWMRKTFCCCVACFDDD